jgi:hypothetical protein
MLHIYTPQTLGLERGTGKNDWKPTFYEFNLLSISLQHFVLGKEIIQKRPKNLEQSDAV